MASTLEPVGGHQDGAPTMSSVGARRSEGVGVDRLGVPGARPARKGRPGTVRRGGEAGRRLSGGPLLALLFLAPALVALTTLVVYPILYTAWLSLHSADSSHFVGLDNYVEIFTSPATRRALTNNVIWVIVAPSLVTALGLIFAVLSERVRMATAFKVVLFMPMAISFLAVGVTFRLVYDESPDRGALNALIVTVHDSFSPPSLYHGARPRDEETLFALPDGGFQTRNPVGVDEPVLLPLVGLADDRIPADAIQAVGATGSGLSGVVWLDFTYGGGGTAGEIDGDEFGMPGLAVQAVRGGQVLATTDTDEYGRFSFPNLTGDGYTIRLSAENFTEPFSGVTWLGPNLVTPAIIGAYIWIWAGFAMVLISAGLAAIPRDALEAARVDGATEWQVFRRVTIPLVRPVLVVVIVTLVINVLKVFDLVLVLAPESAQDDATVVALEMWRVSFDNIGLASALGVLLFMLVLPAMLFNIRRLRRDQ